MLASTFAASAIALVLGGTPVPQGASRVPLLTVRLQAPCGRDIPVTALTIKHGGLGATSDFLRIYAMEGSDRKSAAQPLPSRGDLRLRLRNVTVPACGMTTLALLGDLSTTAQASGEHVFTVTGAATATGSVTVTTTANAASLLRVAPKANQPSVTIEFKPILTSVYYGDARIVSRFLIKGGKTTDQVVQSITFTNDGSARDTDLRNLYVETSSRSRLTDIVPQLDGKMLRVTFSPPLSLSRNEEKMLQLRADVRASYTRTIDFTIDEPSDVEATEARGR
jgi:hypothetical protein